MDNYQIQETLASGSTSKVKRTISIDNKEYAIKVMPKSLKDLKSFSKEISIHKSLNHKNIIKYIDSYKDSENFYLVMELAKYELYTFIECDVGINPVVVHYLIKQLVSGVEYLHSLGICHRDIKPENILIHSDCRLLITDFGYSTFFRYKNKYRRLRTIVGSREYMSPEVCMENYDGELCDIWSIGITLIVLLTGSLPWDCPIMDDKRFKTYMSMKYHYYPPFTKIRDKILDLIRSILVSEKRRINLRGVLNHPWIKEESTVNIDNLFRLMPIKENCKLVFTQPDNNYKPVIRSNLLLSQPINNDNQICEQHRFYKKGDVSSVKKEVCDLFKWMVVPHNLVDNVISFSTTDSKRSILRGEVVFTKVDNYCYVTFRKTKGDYDEFKTFLSSFGENFSGEGR
ncbi:hypothetical protein P3W45_001122 [Vairimorpha bombi]|jgi:serine/threonine-protein kinase CHEK1